MEEKNNLADIIQLLMDNVKKEYLAKIDRAIAQKEAGTMTEHDIIEG